MIRIYYIGNSYLMDYIKQLPGISQFYKFYLETYLQLDYNKELPFFQHVQLGQTSEDKQLHFLNAVSSLAMFKSHNFESYKSAFDPFYVAFFIDWQDANIISNYRTICEKKKTSLKSREHPVFIFARGTINDADKSAILLRLNKINTNFLLFELPTSIIDVHAFMNYIIDYFVYESDVTSSQKSTYDALFSTFH